MIEMVVAAEGVMVVIVMAVAATLKVLLVIAVVATAVVIVMAFVAVKYRDGGAGKSGRSLKNLEEVLRPFNV